MSEEEVFDLVEPEFRRIETIANDAYASATSTVSSVNVYASFYAELSERIDALQYQFDQLFIALRDFARVNELYDEEGGSLDEFLNELTKSK